MAVSSCSTASDGVINRWRAVVASLNLNVDEVGADRREPLVGEPVPADGVRQDDGGARGQLATRSVMV
jgi:hypothetical protein